MTGFESGRMINGCFHSLIKEYTASKVIASQKASVSLVINFLYLSLSFAKRNLTGTRVLYFTANIMITPVI